MSAPIYSRQPGKADAQVSGVFYLYKDAAVTHESFEFDGLAQDYVTAVASALAKVHLPPLPAIQRTLLVQGHSGCGAAGEAEALWVTAMTLVQTYSTLSQHLSSCVALVLSESAGSVMEVSASDGGNTASKRDSKRVQSAKSAGSKLL